MLAWLRMVAQKVDATDQAIERRIARIPRSRVDDGMKVLTTTANHGLLWFAIAAALGSRRGVTRRAAVRGVCAIGGASFLANAVAKPVLPRRRPAADALPDFRTIPNPPTSSSFPSGHAASAAAFATAVTMEAPVAGAVIAPIAATVAYSRMHTGVHWTSDVVAGALLGGGVALATRRWWPVRPQIPARARPHADAPALPEGSGLVVVANRGSGSTDSVQDVAELLPGARVVPLEAGEDLTAKLEGALDGAAAAGVAGGDGSVAAGDAVSVNLAIVTVDGAMRRPFVNTASIGGYPDLVRASGERGRAGGPPDEPGYRAGTTANNGSTGPSPHIGFNAVRMRERWQDRLGNWVAAGLALVRVLAKAKPLHLVLDGRKVAVWLLFVGNGPYHPRGMVPAWRPALDTGLLDIRYLRADLRLSRTRFVLAALIGALHRSRTYVQREAPALGVQVLGEPVALATDGEVPVTGNRFDFAVTPGRLVVYRPEG